jgi:hypothetical protein
MPLITIVITLLVVGVLLWLFETYVPMDTTIKRVIHALVIIVVILWLLQILGVLSYVGSVHVGPIRALPR